ncbi:MAG: HPr family phosphocarrier protein [Pseudomonadota bacterium]|nr:HPr family phosphocarrier protein [Pseudomonadota bacterium]
MRTALIKICNRRGLHARAAAKFVKLVAEFNADVFVSKDDKKVTGQSILGLLTLAAALGDTIKVSATGVDEGAVIEAIAKLVERKFDEN